jgi:hypothetical protein
VGDQSETLTIAVALRMVVELVRAIRRAVSRGHEHIAQAEIEEAWLRATESREALWDELDRIVDGE